MPLNRESTIRVLRSTGSTDPTGLTFGELAYVGGNGKLFMGTTAGESLWIGTGITTGGIATDSATLVPTQSAVKTYVDGVVGGGSVVNTFNGSGGTISLTGSGAILYTQSGGTNTISARLAGTGVTGVASFSSTSFDVSAGAEVTIKTDGVSNLQLVNDSVTVTAGNGLAGGGAVSLGGSVTLSNAGVTGVVAGTGITISGGTGNVTITNTGVQTFNGSTAAISLTGSGAILYTQSGGTNTISARVATTGVTGVASFSGTSFVVTAGEVTIANDGVSNAQLVNDSVTVTAGNGLAGGGAVSLGGSVTLSNAGVTGVVAGTGITISGGTGNVTITNTGVQTFNGSTAAISLTGSGAILYTQSGGTNTISARLAGTGVTGVASFNTASFAVSAGADVTIKSGGVSNAQLVNSSHPISAGGASTLNLGDTLTLTGGSNITLSNTANTITLGLANDIVIAGSLTVNGTVVTANVDSFVVEDPMFALGTGNSNDTVDLGFYAQYMAGLDNGRLFTGLFRDATDGKYKLFTGLTGNAEPTTTVNTGGSGYTVATLVVGIDGGTF